MKNDIFPKKIISPDEALVVINYLSDGLIVFNEQKKLSFINLFAQKIFGVDDRVLGIDIEEMVNFSGLKEVFFLLGKEINELNRKELEINKKMILEVSSFPLFKESRKIGYLVILHDVTREKSIEKMKTDFVSLSAHQLRTPLSSINWALDTLLKERLGKLNESQKTLLEQAKESNQRMLALVRDLLDVVKIEEGKYLDKLVPSDFLKIVQDVIKNYQEEIKKKEIKFQLQLTSNKIPKINIDQEKIYSVVQNLIDNALRYSFAGGMIIVSINTDENNLIFSVSDSGIGIPKEDQNNIFNKFFRSSNATRLETEGNGLGLFVSKNIIEAHGGKIWFESEENQGSTFYFTLPLK